MRHFTELDYGLPGRVYRSAMPFNEYSDPHGNCFELARWYGVSVVVVFSPPEECHYAAGGRDLRALYREEGWDVIDLATPDGGVPELPAFLAARDATLAHLRAGRHVLVHCFAGCGRTGLMLAALARWCFGLDGAAACAWVRERVPCAVENQWQEGFVGLDDLAGPTC